ncbi:MAG: hypothetical protein F6K39_29720 [Okeania sp. SIO3B3]|nr:hypothetical protein [Okeania sp. SIO3B3]
MCIVMIFYEARQWEHLALVPDIPFSCRHFFFFSASQDDNFSGVLMV